jgi:hypothetical protein
MIDSSDLARFLNTCVQGPMPDFLHPHDHKKNRTVEKTWDEQSFRESFAGASRRFGRAPLFLSDHDRSEHNRLGVTWAPAATRDELGRIAMLVAAASEAPRTLFQSVLQRCYDEGDTRERRSILRALPLLPSAERFVPLAFEACRSHLQPLFEAIACDNPYPSRYFPNPPMNHLVLKALSLGTALDRIIGLEQRMTPELRRMAADYLSERQAAGRTIPADVWLLLRN